MKNQRLFWQIFPVNLLIIIGAIAAVTWFSTSTVRSFYFDQMRSDIEARALLLEQKIIDLSSNSPGYLQQFCRRAGRRATTRITVVAADGRVLADSNEDPNRMGNHGNRPELIQAFSGNTGSSLRFSRTLGTDMLYVAIPLQLKFSAQPGGLRLSVPVTSIHEVLSSIRSKIIFGSLIVIILAALFSLYLARRISYPLEEIKKEADHLANGDGDHFINLQDIGMSSEMMGLIRSLNQMSGQVQRRILTISRQRNELEAVFSSMTEAVVAIDADGCILRMNSAAGVLLNINTRIVKGKPAQGLLRNLTLVEMISSTLNNNQCIVQEIEFFNGHNHTTVQVRIVPLQDNEEQSIGALAVMSDVTRLNKLENIRREFVANVSHELKTPITSIIGYVETLLEGALDVREDAQQFLETIFRQANRLDAIIDDLLTLSRIEDGIKKDSIDLKYQEISGSLITSLQTCARAASERNITVDLRCPDGLGALVNVSLLEQAVINLLTNAITYSPLDSQVIVEAVSLIDEAGEKIVKISVLDHGSGIGPEHLDRVFERFYRCDKSRSREKGGTGLGLAIVKHIAYSHGGTVGVESKPGHGSVFTLVLRG